MTQRWESLIGKVDLGIESGFPAKRRPRCGNYYTEIEGNNNSASFNGDQTRYRNIDGGEAHVARSFDVRSEIFPLIPSRHWRRALACRGRIHCHGDLSRVPERRKGC